MIFPGSCNNSIVIGKQKTPVIFIGGSHSTVNVSVVCHLCSRGNKMLNFSCKISENKEK